MNRSTKFFGIGWFIAFIIYNIIAFVIPYDFGSENRFEEPMFWVGYGFVILSFIAQIIIFMLFGRSKIDERLFLNIPVLRLGYSAVFISLAVSVVLLLLPVGLYWLSAVICVLVSAVYFMLVQRAVAVADAVEAVTDGVDRKTEFIRNLTVEAKGLLERVSELSRDDVKRVVEALTYSDTASSPQLSALE